jgi:hypothetical protein
MTKRSGLIITGLAFALAAALVFGGFVPALAQDGDDSPDPAFPCPMWRFYDGDKLPEEWDAMPRRFGPGMMRGQNLDDQREEWAEWYASMPDTLPEGWDTAPRPGMMMWYYRNGELPDEWAEWMESHPMWDEDGSFGGRWGDRGRGMRGRGMMGGRW